MKISRISLLSLLSHGIAYIPGYSCGATASEIGARLWDGIFTETPFLWFKSAITNGNTEAVRLLLADGRVDPSARGNSAIRWASSKGHTEIVGLLLADGRVDPSARGNEAIRWASWNGHTETVRLLLANGRVDPSANDNYAIKSASSNGHTDIVGLLLADGRVDPSANDNSAIQWASSNGHTDIVRLLLADGRVDPSARGNSAFRMASSNGHTDIVGLLLADRRVDPYAIRWTVGEIGTRLLDEFASVLKWMEMRLSGAAPEANLVEVNEMTEACSICLEEAGGKGFSTECKHQFHGPCLAKWIAIGGMSCPMCRRNIQKKA